MGSQLNANCQKAIDGGFIHGAVFCATNSAGTFTYTRALGQRTLLSGEKVALRSDDLVCLAGATGLITTVAALQCVEDGLLSLTGDVSSWAPELAAKQVITGHTPAAHGGEPIMEAAGAPITLTMLLTHSSGVVFDFLHPDVGRWRRRFAPPDPDAQTTVEETYTYPLGFQPGRGWMWGAGLDWAGRIIEHATGQTLGAFVQSRVFAPLGIVDAQFYPVTRADLQARQVDRNPQDQEGYGRAALGMGGVMNKCSRGHFGGHGLFMTAPDFTKILHSLLANDGALLRTTTVDDMFTDHLSGAAADGLASALAGPLGPFLVPDLTEPESRTGQGLGGLLSQEDVEGGYGEGTMSWIGSMPVVWFVDRRRDLCGFASVQATLEPAGTSRVLGLKMDFQKQIYVEYDAWKKKSSQ